MSKILIIYHTTDGHTKLICSRLQQVIEEQSHQVTLVPVEDAKSLDLNSFDKVVLGGSVRYGKHSPLIADFITQNKTLLDNMPNALFSVNLVARKPEKSRPEANPYLQKFLKQLAWQPKEVVVIAGMLDYPSYTFWDRIMIQMIMWMTKGPTDPKAVIEFTDWEKVEGFGRRICEMN